MLTEEESARPNLEELTKEIETLSLKKSNFDRLFMAETIKTDNNFT